MVIHIHTYILLLSPIGVANSIVGNCVSKKILNIECHFQHNIVTFNKLLDIIGKIVSFSIKLL